MSSRGIRFVTTGAVILAFLVVTLGAYTRLTHAGLGCPDWPGCYGHLTVSGAEKEQYLTSRDYPQIPLEARKAWTEMAHRYVAGTLGIVIFFIGCTLVWQRWRSAVMAPVPGRGWCLSLGLMVLVLFQAALGMWTVTLKLLPVVVMGHLLGGILVFSCLCLLRWQLSGLSSCGGGAWRNWLVFGAVLVFCQITLGGWVSANYAGTACTGFPQCNGQWLPALDFAGGFHLSSAQGLDYQGGVLESKARITIQFMHRLGALVTFLYIGSLSLIMLFRATNRFLRVAAGCALLLVVLQVVLGILNVIKLVPLSIAVAHNGVAALLMASLMMMVSFAARRPSYGD